MTQKITSSCKFAIPFVLFFTLSLSTRAQLWISFGPTTDASNSCYIDVNFSVADIGTNENYVFITRSNDGGSTFNVIGTVFIPSSFQNNGSTFTSSFQDTDPYGPNSTQSGSVEYRAYIIKSDGVSQSFSTVTAINIPSSRSSCSGISNPCGGNSTSISGSTTMTTASGQYTVTSNTQVNWSITGSSPAGIATLSASLPNPNNPSSWLATLNATGNGTVTITASYPDCNSSVNLTITINDPALCVPPPTPGITIRGIEPLRFGTQMDVTVSTSAPPPYLWFVNGVQVFSASTTSATINGGSNCNVTNTLKVQVSNSCGSSSATTQYVRPCGNTPFAVFPNPAKGTITVTSAGADATTQAATLSTNPTPAHPIANKIYQVKISDKYGALRKAISYPRGESNIQIDLSGLPPGNYILQIYDNSTWNSQQIMITN
jgi:hypothetical protein